MSLQQSIKPNTRPSEMPNNHRLHERVALHMDAFAIFDGESQARVKTENVSETGLGILSPVLALPKTNCWVKLTMQLENQTEKEFDLYAEVIHGYYSHKNKLFKIGVRFIQPQPELMRLIQNKQA